MSARRKPQTPAGGKPVSVTQARKQMGELLHKKVVKQGKLPKAKTSY